MEGAKANEICTSRESRMTISLATEIEIIEIKSASTASTATTIAKVPALEERSSRAADARSELRTRTRLSLILITSNRYLFQTLFVNLYIIILPLHDIVDFVKPQNVGLR
jgi:hypothetical protein